MELCSSPFSTEFLLKKCRTNIFLPFYHTVSNEQLPHISNLYVYRNEKLFREDLDFFASHFSFVELKDIVNHLKNGKKLPEKALHISFDDGLRQVYDVAAPILKEKGIPATFFVNTGFIDNKDLFYKYKSSLISERLEKLSPVAISQMKTLLKTESDLRQALKNIRWTDKHLLDEAAVICNIDYAGFLNDEKPYMTSGQISSLIKDGFTIGSHSIDHPNFSDITQEEQIRQCVESMDYLQKTFGIEIRSFAYPFSDFSLSANEIKAIGGHFDCTFGTSGINDDIYPSNLQRFEMEKTRLPGKKIIRRKATARWAKIMSNKKQLRRK